MQSERDIDCLIIGGGPAGLTAAIYVARFHLSVVVIDAGDSRAAKIPLTRNHAGFPDGISGSELLFRMREQATRYGAVLKRGSVTSLRREEDGFRAETASASFVARSVLIATGVVNRRPDTIDDAMHDRALAAGLVRYCPVCDGFEVTDQAVAVIGTGERGTAEALFLRGYTGNVTLAAPCGGHNLNAEQIAQLADANIAIAGSCEAITVASDQVVLTIDEQLATFDTVYPALGSDIRSELAAQVGAAKLDDGCLIVDSHQRTNVARLYAAGDVVIGLDQISHAMGEGGVAATTIRNDLARRTPFRR